MKEKRTEENKQVAALYIVFELYRDYARRTHITLQEDGSFVCGDSVFARTSATGPSGVSSQLAYLLKKPIPTGALIVLIFDSESASLVQNSATLSRPDWNAEITAGEFEGFVKRSISQLHQHDRSTAAKLLGTHELQLQLCDVDIVQLKVDNHRVISPIGFRSHDVTLTIRQAFVRIESWQQIVARIPEDQIITVTTRGGFWSGCVGTINHDCALVLDIDEHQTVVYETKNGSVAIRDSILWGSENIFKAVVAPFGMPLSFAPNIINICFDDLCSPAVKKPITDAITSEFSILSHAIEAHQARRSLPVYIHSAFELPAFSVLEKLDLGHKLRVPFSFISLSFVSKAVVHYTKSQSKEEHLPSFATPLAVVARASAGSHGALLQKNPNQRMRWIT
jgi:hypothetical protein